MTCKHLLLLLIIQATASLAFAQSPTCASFHVGRFKIRGYGADTSYTYVVRTRTEQIETNDSYGCKVIFSIKWIDECTYELRPKKLLKGDPAIMGDGNSYIRSRIKNAGSKGYTAETTGSFLKAPVDFYVELIK